LSKRFTVLLVTAMAFAAFAVGCGSSSDDSTEAVVLTKAEFIEQGDEICVEGSKQIEKEADEFAEDNDVDTSNPKTEDQEEVITTVVGPALQAQAEEISALGAPEGEEETVTAIVEALEDGAAELEDDPGALLGDNGSNPLEEAEKLAGDFGFKECGQN
jgi:hypothetical protein